MPNLKEVRQRIDSIQSTRQITNAMKMVAASKLHKAQNAILALRPYATHLLEISTHLNNNTAKNQPQPIQNIESKSLYLIISSSRGLCGSFNANIIKQAEQQIAMSIETSNTPPVLYCIGKKAADYFTKNYTLNIQHYHELLETPSRKLITPLSQEILTAFNKNTYNKVWIVYHHYQNAALQNVVTKQLLPIQNNTIGSPHNETKEFIYEPQKSAVQEKLIPQTVAINIFEALLNSLASEHGARMTSMHQATDNASSLLHDLKLSYNKARQTAITNEILEITSGANALNE